MATYEVGPNDLTTGATLNAGDSQQVYGVADRTTIGTGAAQTVFGGGSAYNTMINNGGLQTGLANTTLVDTTIQFGGRQEVFETANNTTISSGSIQTVYGSSDTTYVASSSTLILSPGYANQTSQFTNITLGPTAQNEAAQGGTLVVNAGTVLSGGYLNADNGIHLTPTTYIVTGPFSVITGGRIALPFLAYSPSTTVTFNSENSILSVSSAGSGQYDLQLSGDYTGVTFGAGNAFYAEIPQSPAGTIISAFEYCFCAGTRIATPDGTMAVEHLAVGTMVLTRDNGPQAVRWIGTTEGVNDVEAVVIVRAGALGDGTPERDLRVTRGHSFLFGEVLVPIGELINGRSILWDAVERFTVYHVALAEHDVLIAEGAYAESYRDDGNRTGFASQHGLVATLNQPPCRRIVSAGPEVDRIWQDLAARAGCDETPLTRDADLHLLVDGVRVDPMAVDGNRHRFRIDHPISALQINSRSAVPAYLGYARDARRLGIAVGGVVIDGANERREFAFDAHGFAAGFNHPEQGFRWTRGLAHLPPTCFTGLDRFEITLDVQSVAAYAA